MRRPGSMRPPIGRAADRFRRWLRSTHCDGSSQSGVSDGLNVPPVHDRSLGASRGLNRARDMDLCVMMLTTA